MKYRREIDGLRAIAVVPVMLFHAGITGFSGGYVGVDVFFVLSGYLISALLIRELEQGQFSLIRFYERRARRILPALLLVVICCLPFAWAWMLPFQLESFAYSLIAVGLFASNVLFWRESGYFAAAAEEKPLLHTWSLAVEEQYYLLFPLLLLLLWRMRWQSVAVPVIATIAVVSLLLAEWGVRHSPSAAFYLAPTRAWELLAGSLAAFAVRRWGVFDNDAIAGVGLFAVLAAMVIFDTSTPVPGVWMMIPVGGTVALVLCAGADTRTARLLSWKPLVGIGLISYSAYLWHQPLFAFARIRLHEGATSGLLLALSVVALLLAGLSWRFVEQPFRGQSPKVLPGQKALLSWAAACLVGLGLLGAIGGWREGFPDRIPADVLRIAEIGQDVKMDCGSGDRWNGCLLGDPNAVPQVALVGDSHAGRYAWAFDNILNERGQAIQYAGSGWCVPLLNFTTNDMDKNTTICRREMDAALNALIADPQIETIAMAAQWSNYTQGFRHGEPVSAYAYANSGNRDPAQNPVEFANALSATVNVMQAAGKRVVLIEPVPEYTFNVPDRLASIKLHGSGTEALHITQVAYQTRNASLFAVLDTFSPTDLERFAVTPFFCDVATCEPVSNDGLPLYTDSNHLSRLGLSQVAEPILESLLR